MAFLIASFVLMIFSLSDKRAFFYFIPPVVAIYFSMHYGYGFDWINYLNSYEIVRWQNIPLTEPGLFYTMKLADYFNLSFGQMFLFISAFNYYCLYRFCKIFKNPMFAFFCAFSFFGFYMYAEQIRQGLALSIILLGLSKHGFESKKIYIWMILAAFFHVSAFFLVICKFVSPSSLRSFRKNIVLMTIVVFGFLIVFTTPSLVSFIPYVGSKVADYSASYDSSWGGFITLFLLSKYTYLYLFSIIVVYVCFVKSKDKEILKSVISLYFLMLSKITPFLLRFGYYFVPWLILGLDNYFYEKQKKGVIFVKKTMIHAIILLISSVTMWNPALFTATQTPLSVFDSQYSVDKEVSNKCIIVYRTGFGRDVLPSCG